MITAHTSYCSHCRVITNQRVAVAPLIVTEPDGKEKIVVLKTYHCESCWLFVRSEEEWSFLNSVFYEMIQNEKLIAYL